MDKGGPTSSFLICLTGFWVLDQLPDPPTSCQDLLHQNNHTTTHPNPPVQDSEHAHEEDGRHQTVEDDEVEEDEDREETGQLTTWAE